MVLPYKTNHLILKAITRLVLLKSKNADIPSLISLQIRTYHHIVV